MMRIDVAELIASRRSLGAAIVLSDYASGFELSLSSRYLAPVTLVTLGWGFRAGLGMALLAYGAWIGVSLSDPNPRAGTFLIFWEACIRLLTAAAFVVLIDQLKRGLEREMQRSRRDLDCRHGIRATTADISLGARVRLGASAPVARHRVPPG